MKCIIIEDELPAQQILEKFANQTAQLECIGIFESISQLPLTILNEIDFILLDIQLPGINGLAFLKSLEKKPKVIITTAYRDYAIDAFEEAVVDYLLKPFSYQRFLKAILRIQHSIQQKEEVVTKPDLFIYANKAFHKVAKQDIYYVKSEVDYVSILYKHQKLLVQDSLNNWEQKLKQDGFIRIHRSYLINFDKVEKVEGNLVFINNETIPIGKTYRTTFFERIK